MYRDTPLAGNETGVQFIDQPTKAYTLYRKMPRKLPGCGIISRDTGLFLEENMANKTKTRLPGHQLFYFAACPYCVKVRLVLWWMGVELPLMDILSDPKNKAELIAGGGKKQVPCLRIEYENEDARWLYESGSIIRYLRRQLSG